MKHSSTAPQYLNAQQLSPILSEKPLYKTEQYQFASGLTPCGRIETQSRRFQFLYWLLRAK